MKTPSLRYSPAIRPVPGDLGAYMENGDLVLPVEVRAINETSCYHDAEDFYAGIATYPDVFAQVCGWPDVNDAARAAGKLKDALRGHVDDARLDTQTAPGVTKTEDLAKSFSGHGRPVDRHMPGKSGKAKNFTPKA